jgi:hypothetical protein
MTTIDSWPVEISLYEEDGKTQAEARLTHAPARPPVYIDGPEHRPGLLRGSKAVLAVVNAAGSGVRGQLSWPS